MKIYFTFLCLLITGGLANATTQTTSNQDKPSLLYVKSYSEDRSAAFAAYENYYYGGLIYPNDYDYVNYSEQETISEWIRCNDGQPASASCQQNNSYNFYENVVEDAYFDNYADFANVTSGLAISSGVQIANTSVATWDSETNNATPPVNRSTNYPIPALTTTNTGVSPPIQWEHCDINTPLVDRTFSEAGYYDDTTCKETYGRKAQTQLKIKTGGKAISKLNHLCKLSDISATGVSPINVGLGYQDNYSIGDGSGDNWQTSFSPFEYPYIILGYNGDYGYANSFSVLPQNITIGNYGAAGANGVKYLLVPDGSDVDVTPYVAGMDYYTFGMSETEGIKEDWQQVVRNEIYSDTGGAADMNIYSATNGFMNNRTNIQAVYAFYQKLFGENANLLWAGLGKLAGAPVYAGLSDAQYALSSFGIDLTAFQNTLITMNTNILQDLAWQSEAYYKGGIDALNEVYAVEPTALDSATIAAWREIDDGVQNNIASEIQNGNLQLAHREQLTVLQSNYDTLNGMGSIITNVMSILAQNPVSTGTNFLTVVPGGNLSTFVDRWNWITNSAGGIWPNWVAAAPTTQSSWVNIPLKTRAANYTFLPLFLYPIQ